MKTQKRGRDDYLHFHRNTKIQKRGRDDFHHFHRNRNIQIQINTINTNTKHRKNCECCPGHSLTHSLFFNVMIQVSQFVIDIGGGDLISQIGSYTTFSILTGGFYCSFPWGTRKKYSFWDSSAFDPLYPGSENFDENPIFGDFRRITTFS